MLIPSNFRAAPDRRAKLDRNRERDVSEQIALGIPAKAQVSGEGLFDARYVASYISIFRLFIFTRHKIQGDPSPGEPRLG